MYGIIRIADVIERIDDKENRVHVWVSPPHTRQREFKKNGRTTRRRPYPRNICVYAENHGHLNFKDGKYEFD